MQWSYVILLLFMISEVKLSSNEECPNVKANNCVLTNRKKRYLTFPDKSNVVLTISLVKAFMTHAPSGWNIALEIDVLFPLPDEKESNTYWRKKLHHKQKRDVWDRMRNALDLHNLDGRACILRSVCEARTHLAPPGLSLVHDILRAIFSPPIHDENLPEEFHENYNELQDDDYCNNYGSCPISLINFVTVLNKRNK